MVKTAYSCDRCATLQRRGILRSRTRAQKKELNKLEKDIKKETQADEGHKHWSRVISNGFLGELDRFCNGRDRYEERSWLIQVIEEMFRAFYEHWSALTSEGRLPPVIWAAELAFSGQ